MGSWKGSGGKEEKKDEWKMKVAVGRCDEEANDGVRATPPR
jgi:hypothetical protein